MMRSFYCPNRPFAVYDHMVQKPPCWRANYPLGHPKQKNIKLSCFIWDVPVGSLLSSMAVFVPCDRKLQRVYLVQIKSHADFLPRFHCEILRYPNSVTVPRCKNGLAVAWETPAKIVSKTQQVQFTQSNFFTNKT